MSTLTTAIAIVVSTVSGDGSFFFGLFYLLDRDYYFRRSIRRHPWPATDQDWKRSWPI